MFDKDIELVQDVTEFNMRPLPSQPELVVRVVIRRNSSCSCTVKSIYALDCHQVVNRGNGTQGINISKLF